MKKIYMYVLLFICVLSLSAQEMITGEIVYLEGEVNLSRNGEFLPFHEVDMGTIIEEEDMIRTGPDGYAEVELSYPQEGTLLKIQANTAFYFDNRSAGEKNTTSINLLSGTIGLKVSKLAKNQNMNVETQSAVMGIRGTDFDVNMAPTGEILITCEEGKVSCSTPAMEVFSIPGQVCEQADGKDFNARNVPVEELNSYKKNWWNARMEALVTIGPMAAEYYSGRYDRQLRLFDDAWLSLKREQKLFKEYADLLEKGGSVSRSKANIDKITLTAPIIKMRSVLPLMEEVFYTMLVLEEYQNKGAFTGSTDYFKNFSRGKDSMEEVIVLARYYMSIYEKITDMANPFGTGGMMGSMLGN
jgi:hypothetical protein